MKKTEPKKRVTPPTVFTIEFKKKIISEYLESDLTKREILDKYGIRSNSAIQSWMRKLGIHDPFGKKDYLGLINHDRLKKKPEPSELELEKKALEKRIRELEQKLEEEQIRTEMLTRVIEIAENDYKLNIRKKPNTK